MLDIAAPDLSPREWAGVRQALGEVANRGCGAPAGGSLFGYVGRVGAVLSGRSHPPRPLSPRQQAVRDFLCESGRTGRIAERHVPVLADHGFTRPQIEAMALLGA